MQACCRRKSLSCRYVAGYVSRARLIGMLLNDSIEMIKWVKCCYRSVTEVGVVTITYKCNGHT